MSQPTYTGVKDADPRDAATVNAIFTALTGSSAALDASNFADEGLDERSMSSNTVTDGRDVATYAGGMAAPVVGAYPLFVVFDPSGAAPHSLSNGPWPAAGAGWTVGQNIGVVRVEFATEWSFAYAAATSPILYFRFEYQIDGGGWTAVPKSLRQRQGANRIGTKTAGAQNDGNWYDSIRYAFDIPYPADGASHTINAVRIAVADSAGGLGGIAFDHSEFRAKRYIRTVT